ncbi:MAG: nucleotidyltransferase domain-containing protein [Chloroflexi bacterium]|nr:nucleotidyltransferase domain-containing protein [Chloroflexota bacterium]
MSKKIDWTVTNSVWQSTPNIIAAWAFGSAQDGIVRTEGDVDIGILVKLPMSFDEQLNVVGQLQSVLQFEKVDLVILNEANSMLRFEAVSGRRLFCHDLSKMAAFVSLTAREYEDEMAQWRMALQNLTALKEENGENQRQKF